MDLEMNAIAPLAMLSINFGIMWANNGGISQKATGESLALAFAGWASSALTLVAMIQYVF